MHGHMGQRRLPITHHIQGIGEFFARDFFRVHVDGNVIHVARHGSGTENTLQAGNQPVIQHPRPEVAHHVRQ